MSHRTQLRIAAIGVLSLALSWTPRPAPAQSLMYGRTAVRVPERTDAGDWVGTWYYASRVRRMAVWIREERGKYQVRLQVRGQAGVGESLSTDWDGRADTAQGGKPSKFSLEIMDADADVMNCRWTWNRGTEENGRTERGEFTMYRSGYGRQMVWNFQKFHEEVRGKSARTTDTDQVVWTFQKASRHQALWEELPF